jgi:uncharacterized protein (DUF1697 family)
VAGRCLAPGPPLVRAARPVGPDAHPWAAVRTHIPITHARYGLAMDRYVALLRGINVGGRSKVEMPRLKSMFEDLGCDSVRTYINSGNVVFDDGRKEATLVRVIEAALETTFGWKLRIVLRSQAEVGALLEHVPATWTNDAKQKTDVMFLWAEVDRPEALDAIVTDPAVENVLFLDGAVVWNVSRANAKRSNAVRLVKSDLYAHLTIRNINTVRKLHAMMSD